MSALDSPWYVEDNGVRTRDGYVCFIDDASVTVPRGDRPAVLACLAAAPAMLAKLQQLAAECAECHGTGYVPLPFSGGVLSRARCPDCADVREVIALAVQP